VKPKAPLSLRLDPKVEERLTEAAKRLKLKKYQLAIMAIEAAITAVERNDNRLVLPIEFDLEVTRVPAPRSGTPGEKYPRHHEEASLVEERALPPGSAKVSRREKN